MAATAAKTAQAAKTAIVTGATSGIGEAAARLLAARGMRVLLVGRNQSAGQRIVDEIGEAGGDAAFFAGDMAVPADIAAMVEDAMRRWQRLDFAFNNAGIFGAEAAFHEQEDAVWDEWIAVNLSGVYRCMKHQIGAMLETMKRHGTTCCIVNNASVVAHRGSKYAGPAYVASKHGVLGLTRQAAVAYGPLGIRVNAISPGPTLTAATAPVAAQGGPVMEALTDDLLPMGRMASPEEVAGVVAFLFSQEAGRINGQDIAVDGGLLAAL